MWTRELLKTNAKQALQGRYWRSFWICLVLSFVGLGGAGANSGNAARQAVSTVTDDTTAYGGFFLEPYMQATYAEFYAAMRSKALAMGMTTTDELGGFVRHDTYPNDMDF